LLFFIVGDPVRQRFMSVFQGKRPRKNLCGPNFQFPIGGKPPESGLKTKKGIASERNSLPN
jgi:hypothetical protein